MFRNLHPTYHGAYVLLQTFLILTSCTCSKYRLLFVLDRLMNQSTVSDPRNISHSRCLTTANRLLMIYVSNDAPSYKLVTIVEYIIKLCMPIWFNIKSYDSTVYGTKHIFGLVKLCKLLDAGWYKRNNFQLSSVMFMSPILRIYCSQ